MTVASRVLLCSSLGWLLACGGAPERDPVADAKFQNEQRIGREDITKRQEADANFMVDAGTGSRFGAALGALAQQRATSPAVRTWGQQLTRDATALTGALQTLASQKGLTLAGAMSPKQQEMLAQLGTHSGPDLDRRLLEAATEYLDDAHDSFADMADDAYDGDIRAVAAKYAPTLKQHYEQADELRDQLKP